jgi:hypothetical protein
VPTTMQTFAGHCHCAALAFAFRTSLPPERWSVRACQCSFCRRHGALSTSDPAGELEFQVRRPEALQRYRFAQRTADFLLCRECGVYVGAQIVTDRGAFGIINVLALPLLQVSVLAPLAMDYDAESATERIARREQRWTPLARVV